MALEKEIATYRAALPDLLAHGEAGKFALIVGDRLDSLWESSSAAHDAGYNKFGLDGFLVKKVEVAEKAIPLPPYIIMDKCLP